MLGVAGGDEEVGGGESGWRVVLLEVEGDLVAGFAGNLGEGGVGEDVDAFGGEDLGEGFGDIGVFARKDPGGAFEDGDATAEAAQGLGEFEADVAAAEDGEVCGEGVEFEGFDVGEGLCVGEAGDGVDGGAGAGADDEGVGGEGAGFAVGEGEEHGFGGDEAAFAEEEIDVGLGETVLVHLDEAVDHGAFAVADGAHVDGGVGGGEAVGGEFAGEFGDGGGVNDVFGGEAGDVGAGAADVFAFDEGGFLPDAARFQARYLPASPLPRTRRS